MAKENRRRPPMTPGEKLLFLAGVLFCLVLITTAMMGGLFARYVTTGTGSDSARVVKFGQLTLTETGDFPENAQKEKTGIIIPGVDLNKKVTVSFEASEVSTLVFVKVDAPDWTVVDNKTFMKGTLLTWALADGWSYLPGSKYVYYQELAPNTALSDADIIQNGVITVSKSIKEGNIQSLDDLSLSFRACVIQSGGFADAAEAWAYLNG